MPTLVFGGRRKVWTVGAVQEGARYRLCRFQIPGKRAFHDVLYGGQVAYLWKDLLAGCPLPPALEEAHGRDHDVQRWAVPQSGSALALPQTFTRVDVQREQTTISPVPRP